MKRMINDAETLEHLIFKTNDIEFTADGNVYKLSESLEAKQLVKHIKYCYDNKVPLIIYEYANDRVFIATGFSSDSEASLTNLGSNINVILSLTYDGEDTLSTSLENETFISEDNVKTLFGNQSIVGTGNIDLYRHTMTLTTELNDYQLEYISSNNLVVNSLQDLTTLLKPKANQSYFGFVVDSENSTDVGKIVYNGSIWQIIASEDTVNVLSVSDTVETI